MSGFILAEKISQSQIFDESGKRIPTTFLKTSPCYLIDIRTADKHGYAAAVIGAKQTKRNGLSVKGQLTKAGVETPLRFLREVRLEYIKDVQVIEEEGKKGLAFGEVKVFIGEELKPSMIFKAGESVNVSGTSKGKGFQGVVKRHGFAGGPRTHGQSDRERSPGSSGQGTTPGHTYRGKRMAGRMGGERITIENLPIVEVQDEGMTIKGLVPGHTHGLLEVVSVRS